MRWIELKFTHATEIRNIQLYKLLIPLHLLCNPYTPRLPLPGNGKLHIRPRAVASAFSRGSDVDECVWALLYVVGWTLLLIVKTVVYSQIQSAFVFVDILCRKSSSFGNSRIVRRERIFCVIHRELATPRRRFELSENLHRRGWILRWLLIDDGWSQWNWWDDAWTFLINYLTYAVFFRLVNCVRRSVELVSFSVADYIKPTGTRIRRHFGNFK